MTYSLRLGSRIQKSRSAKGLSVSQLASRIGVKPTTVEKWESGETDLRPNKLDQLAGILGVSMIWLLVGEDENIVTSVESPDFNETHMLEEKINRAEELINDLSFLLADIRAQSRRIQRDINAES